MLPAWATVLVALGASALGGIAGALLTTLVRIRHERDELRRTRLVDAADDFLADLARARVALSGVERHLRAARPGADKWASDAGQSVDTATAHAARIALLYGDGSDAAIAANAAVSLARNLLEELRGNAPDWRDVQLDAHRLVQVQAAFNRAAQAVIDRPALARIAPTGEPPASLDEALAQLRIA